MASLGKAERAVFGEGEYRLWEGNLLVSCGPPGNCFAASLRSVMFCSVCLQELTISSSDGAGMFGSVANIYILPLGIRIVSQISMS
jgi:hypothetical protein